MKITATVTLTYDSEVSDFEGSPEEFRSQVETWARDDFNGGVTFEESSIEYS